MADTLPVSSVITEVTEYAGVSINPLSCCRVGVVSSFYPVVCSVTALDGRALGAHSYVDKNTINVVGPCAILTIGVVAVARHTPLVLALVEHGGLLSSHLARRSYPG